MTKLKTSFWQNLIKNEDQFLEIPKLPEQEVLSIMTQWLASRQRRLTAGQMTIVQLAFEHCPIPLFLKLCFDEAIRWCSYSPTEDTVLEHTVRDVINMLFHRIERVHGRILVSKAMGYLTISKYNDFFRWWFYIWFCTLSLMKQIF